MDSYRRLRPLVAGAAVLAGAIGVSRALNRKAVRDEEITYPPLDVPKPIDHDLWIVDSGPISAIGMKLPLRMTVMRLRDGSVLLHSPTRYIPKLAQAIAAIGPIRHLVAPTTAHWKFLPEWQAVCPSARTWAVPGLRDRVQVRQAGVRIDSDLQDTVPEEWTHDIEQGLVRGGGGFCEAWFFHKASRTLVLSDLIENLEPAKLRPLTAMLMGALNATRATTGLHVRAAIGWRKSDARQSVLAMVATQPEHVIWAHGAICGDHAGEQLRRAFGWLI